MSKVVLDMSVSLDGIGAGPNPSAEDPMGAGGERLHAWMPFYDPEQEPTAGVPAASEADARMVQELFAAARGRSSWASGRSTSGSSRGAAPRSRRRASW